MPTKMKPKFFPARSAAAPLFSAPGLFPAVAAAMFVIAGANPCPGTAVPAEPRVWTAPLSDFETPADLAKWQLVGDQDVPFCKVVGSQPPVFELTAEHATSGRNAVVFSCQGVSGTYPTAMMLGADLPVQDWAPYDDLVLDVFNPNDYHVPLCFLATNEGVRDDSVVWSQGPDAPLWDKSGEVIVAPGKQTLRVPLDKVARSRRVTMLRLLYFEPIHSYRLVLDHLRLETAQPAATLAVLQERLGRVEVKVKEGRADVLAPETAKLGESLAALGAAGNKLSSLNDYVLWREKVRAVADTLGDLENRVPIALFNKQVKPHEWGYGWTDGTTKVYRTELPFGGEIGGTVRLELAANEGEGVQLVLRSRNAVRQNVRVKVSDLTNDAGHTIPSAQVEVAPVGYVDTKKPYYPVPFVGWHPDPLLTFLDSFRLDEEVWQPVWLDVRTTPDQKPGLYRGTITCTADDVKELAVPIEVRVWDFAVPHEQHFPTAFSLMDQIMYRPYGAHVPDEEWQKYMAYCRGEIEVSDLGDGEARRLYELRSKFRRMCFDHRIAPQALYSYFPVRIDDAKEILASGASSFVIMNMNGPLNDLMGRDVDASGYWEDEATAMVSDEGKKLVFDRLDKYLPLLEKEGLMDKAVLYGCDEYPTKRFPGMLDLLRDIRGRYPKLRLSTTAFDHSYGRDTGMADLMDIWIPLLPKYELNPGSVAEAKARGKEVWYYTCILPHRPWPNLFIEYPAAENRLITGFMPFKYDVDGFLYYSIYSGSTGRYSTDETGRKSRGKAPFRHELMTKGPLTEFDGNTEGVYSGDGQLMYPGQDGPVPTIRLKFVRDGLEDYEYLWLLRQRLAEAKAGRLKLSPSWQDRATALLAVPDTVVESLTEFTRDGSVLLEARRQAAALLEEAP